MVYMLKRLLWPAVLLLIAAVIIIGLKIAPSARTTLNIISEVPTSDRYVAITFDDGPDPVYTPVILDLLRQNHIKATFFLIGLHSEWYPDLVKRIKSEGHEIGNHSYLHKSYLNKCDQYVIDDIQKTNNLLTSLTGIRPTLLRPPFGEYNEQTLQIANQEHLLVVKWSINSMDWERPAAYVMDKQVLGHLKPGQIILYHDGGGRRKETVRAVANFIKTAKSNGYQFLTISEMMERSDYHKSAN